VDVSSETLDAQVRPGGAERRFAATADGIADLAAFCREHGVELVAMEATGGYERLAYSTLWTHRIPTAVVNPRAVRQFAQAMGSLEKTDRIDAGMIAWFAETKRIVPQDPPSEAQERLKALVTRLRQLTELRLAQNNQRRLVSEASVRRGFDELLALLARQIRAIEGEIAALLAADKLWHALDEAFRSIKGVADRTVARLMAEIPEIGTIGGKPASKLVGLAPLANDSGKAKGSRYTRGGRTHVRSILFVVAEIVRRYDPDFADFHKRLSEKGKPKKVIRMALAHKLLVRLNAKARDVRRNLALADLAA
jgi:transposase